MTLRFVGIAFLLIISSFLVGVFEYYEREKTRETRVLETEAVFFINDTALDVGIADTEAERIRGLSDIPLIKRNEGLLFIFPESETHGIWMRHMQFPIDIIWFDKHFVVVDMIERATPDSYPFIFTPHKAAQYILETTSGFVSDFDISVGDTGLLKLGEGVF